MKIEAYCDGGCRNNQQKDNIGGWGVYMTCGKESRIYNGGERNTTNNRMELTSCIKALENIDGDPWIEIIMDSAYVVNAFNDNWIDNWIKRGWKTANKKPVLNQDLWCRLIELTKQFSSVKFIKCKGHSGNFGNEKADTLANLAMDEIGSR